MRFLYATATLFVLTAAAGQAGTLNFSYDTGHGIFAGTMSGTLQGNNNTFLVSSLDSLTYGGVAGPSLPFVTSVDALIYGTPLPATVSLDGSYMDFAACSGSACNVSYFGFAVDNAFQINALGNHPGYLASPALGNGGSFSASNWSASVGGEAPEPGTLTLGLAATAFATAVSRRKRLASPE